MRLIGKLQLEEFWSGCPQAKKPLLRWVDIVQAAQWSSFADIRRTFGSVDLYHNKGVSLVVFNIGGKKFRLTGSIQYVRKNITGTVVVTRIEKHPDYDKHNKGIRGAK